MGITIEGGVRSSHKPRCPKCNNVIDGHKAVTGVPKLAGPGDTVVCLYCNSVLEIMEDHSLRVVPDDKLRKKFEQDPLFKRELKKAKAFAKNVINRHRSKYN